MASDQKLQRTVQAVAEAVQVFTAGTFDFAESIKQIWGPQPEPDVAETSATLPVDGMQDVQMLDDLSERTPVSQTADPPALHYQNHSPMTMRDEETELQHQMIEPLETPDVQPSTGYDVLTGPSSKCGRVCYECVHYWQENWRFNCILQFLPCEWTSDWPQCKLCSSRRTPCNLVSIRKSPEISAY
jgi:hypothetical protein